MDRQTALRDHSPETHPEFDRLVRTIWRLRQPDGCPWDKEQTHQSITRNMVEEAYEAVEAIEQHSAAKAVRAADTKITAQLTEANGHLCEELGDVLEQVLLHAQIAADDGDFDIDDICRELNEKLVRRHPHVFGDPNASAAGASNSEEALDRWEEVKAVERAAKGETARKPGLLDSVPRSLPALMQAQKISKRAAKAGFDWDTVDEIWEKVGEERLEFEREELGTDAATMEFGDILFALVNVARRCGIDAEEALAASNAKFRRRWAAMEEASDLSELDTAELNQLWEQIKGQR
ncbi:MAG: nucleoside triphosphate pyrophosphohydrolase [Coriobacteriales bacterium]|nr:nucleoside triphosphate pyrophosphohydrolase [Coriobacteriales bacterium]